MKTKNHHYSHEIQKMTQCLFDKHINSNLTEMHLSSGAMIPQPTRIFNKSSAFQCFFDLLMLIKQLWKSENLWKKVQMTEVHSVISLLLQLASHLESFVLTAEISVFACAVFFTQDDSYNSS
jgi:hypothetical protein